MTGYMRNWLVTRLLADAELDLAMSRAVRAVVRYCPTCESPLQECEGGWHCDHCEQGWSPAALAAADPESAEGF